MVRRGKEAPDYQGDKNEKTKNPRGTKAGANYRQNAAGDFYFNVCVYGSTICFVMTSLLCIAMAVYFEARGEPLEGQVAVAQVIENRVQSDRYPDDACAVVKQGKYVSWREYPLRYECQFSFWCDGLPEDITNNQAWGQAWIVTVANQLGWYPDYVQGATHYHADDIHTPSWAERELITTIIDSHIFYRL